MGDSWKDLQYLHGLGNHHHSEALKGALPAHNNPQKCPYGLYAEQISGTAFTVPRHKNQFSYVYRIRPSVVAEPFQPLNGTQVLTMDQLVVDPNQFRWGPMPLPSEAAKVDFVQGLQTMAGAGDPGMKDGVAVYMYSCNQSMQNKAFNNSDGDFLIVPQKGALKITTELGKLYVKPREICVVQRNIRFSVEVEEASRGYVLEVFKGHFQLPDLGPIGASGLANARDFELPTAWYEDRAAEFTVVNKFIGKMFACKQKFSTFNVVAWHGNYVPFKYNLDKFCTINSVMYDHLDPSIFTVLTCPSDEPGTAVADFVIFPPRWMVQEDTFRPPYYHRNMMSEFMGQIDGTYDARVGFLPGSASLHSCGTPHGPDAPTFEKASTEELKPHKYQGGLGMMFETGALLKVSPKAIAAEHRDIEYPKCWEGLKSHFTG